MRKHLAILISLLLYGPDAYALRIAGLSEAEQDYHGKIIDYVMENIGADTAYDWKSYSGKGTVTASTPFVSKSKAACRNYTESFEVQGHAAKFKGVACRRSSGDGWCQLLPKDAQTCAMEHPGYMIGFGGGGDNVTISAPDVAVNGGDVDISAPSIHGPSINGPNINTNFRSGYSSSSSPSSSNNANKHDDGQHKGRAVAYDVTDTLGNGAAKGTEVGLGWWNALFR